jgi:endonuclease YncB( thermonuclease family)
MFHFLHKIYLLGWAALIIGVVVLLYPRSGISEQLEVGLEVWRNSDGISDRTLEHISGTPIRIFDGTTFTLRGPENQLYTIGLVGLSIPSRPPFSPAESKALLSDLILSNEVDLALSWLDPQLRGLAVVRLGKTNVNAVMIKSGFATLNRNYIKGLPLLDQYKLIQAERAASLEAASSESKNSK